MKAFIFCSQCGRQAVILLPNNSCQGCYRRQSVRKQVRTKRNW